MKQKKPDYNLLKLTIKSGKCCACCKYYKPHGMVGGCKKVRKKSSYEIWVFPDQLCDWFEAKVRSTL